jgi:hypothetical protein
MSSLNARLRIIIKNISNVLSKKTKQAIRPDDNIECYRMALLLSDTSTVELGTRNFFFYVRNRNSAN